MDAIKKLNEIKEGWIGYLMGKKKSLPLITSRAEICANCEINKNNFCSRSKGGCGCYIPAKICCLDCKCPKAKW